MNKQSFIQGTMILLAAGIINRMLGFIPRIVLPRLIGPVGIGLYQMGYPFLIVVLTLITGGIPLAVSKMVAEAESIGDEHKVRRILSSAMTITGILSAIFTLICLFGAQWITVHLFTDRRVYYTFVAMSPIIPLVGVSSVLRGYFQGRQNMIPTASSQISETLVRIVAVLVLAYMLVPYGIEYAAAGAMIGVLTGELAGMLVLLFHYRKNKYADSTVESVQGPLRKKGILKELLGISVPVTGSKLVGSGSYFLESILIVQSLAAAGVTTALATAQYGALQGMVIPILLLPNALTYSLAVSLVPSLSEAAAKNDYVTIKKRLRQSLRLALVAGAPFPVIMYMLADPLCLYLYNQIEVGNLLKMMAPVALFIYFQGPLLAALQALDRPGTALLNTFISASVKLILIVFLASRPSLGIIGAVIAINVNIVLSTVLHWRSITRLLQFSLHSFDYVKVLSVMAAMGLCIALVMNQSWPDGQFAKFITALIAGITVYLWLIVKFKLVDKYDLVRIPWMGRWISRWF